MRACACVSVPAHVFAATAARFAPPQASLASGLPAASQRCAALVSDPLRRGPVERGREMEITYNYGRDYLTNVITRLSCNATSAGRKESMRA